MDSYKPRLEMLYNEKLRSSLKEQFKYKNDLMIPKLEKVVLNMGLGLDGNDAKILKASEEDLAKITGQTRRINLYVGVHKMRIFIREELSDLLRKIF